MGVRLPGPGERPGALRPGPAPWGGEPLDTAALADLREDFNASDLPFKVDLVEWATTAAPFREVIARAKVVIQSPAEA